MKTILEYEVPVDETFELELPEGFEPLTVQVHNGKTQLYCLVDPAQPLRAERFAVIGTDHERAELAQGRYIGTYQIQCGVLVHHLFLLPKI